MLILILPMIIVLFPILLLFLIVKYWKKGKQIPNGKKIAIGLGFTILGVIFTLLAMIVPIQGHMTGGIQCATGAIIFIPIGIKVNLIGIPLILIFEKKIRGIRKIKDKELVESVNDFVLE